MAQTDSPAFQPRFQSHTEYRDALSKKPTDAPLHLDFGLFCLSKAQLDLGMAELKTAKHLGADHPQLNELMAQVEQHRPALEELDHNQYYRMRSLADAILQKESKAGTSLLDIGGGHGLLSRFVPDFSYCLAEPDVNGISGLELPFTENSFDVVVACHVLEHIPENDREAFLDQLCKTGRRHVFILNPFHIEGSNEIERMTMVYELTGASWAKEHLDCTLPRLEQIESYAKKKGYTYSIKANGTQSTGLALVMMTHYAQLGGRTHDLKRINRYYNTLDPKMLVNERAPNAYLVHFELAAS